MQSKKIIAACYCRLSDDDEQDGTSVSIETQKKILGNDVVHIIKTKNLVGLKVHIC